MTKIIQRHDTAANWTAVNPVLAAGEIGVETDTNKFKFGDGTSTWNSLAYVTGGGVQSETIRSMVVMTQAEYDALTTKDATALYLIREETT